MFPISNTLSATYSFLIGAVPFLRSLSVAGKEVSSTVSSLSFFSAGRSVPSSAWPCLSTLSALVVADSLPGNGGCAGFDSSIRPSGWGLFKDCEGSSGFANALPSSSPIGSWLLTDEAIVDVVTFQVDQFHDLESSSGIKLRRGTGRQVGVPYELWVTSGWNNAQAL
jgi:hypothetical protein